LCLVGDFDFGDGVVFLDDGVFGDE